jgi:hypothetical protein
MASSSHGNYPNWYLISGANDHITGELEKLSIHERYNGGDQIHATNGEGVTSPPLTRTISHNQDHYGVSLPK